MVVFILPLVILFSKDDPLFRLLWPAGLNQENTKGAQNLLSWFHSTKIAKKTHWGAIADDEATPGRTDLWDPQAEMWETWVNTRERAQKESWFHPLPTSCTYTSLQYLLLIPQQKQSESTSMVTNVFHNKELLPLIFVINAFYKKNGKIR